MPANRLCALVRSAAAYRVEACFLAALAFTLANRADDRRHDTIDVHTATFQHDVIHEVEPVRVVAPHAPSAVAQRTRHEALPAIAPRAVTQPTRRDALPAKAPVAASGSRFRVVSAGGTKTLVLKADSSAFRYCSVVSEGAGAAESKASCRVIRFVPASGGVVVAKSAAAGT